jgi:hypothetical protein
MNQEEYPQVGRTSFGQVAIAGKTYTHDLYIRANGKVKKRDKKLAKQLYGSSHTIGPAELEKVCKGDPEVLLIGTGMSGLAELNEEARRYLAQRSIRCQALPTPEAVEAYNQSDQRKALLIHLTC